MSNRDTVMARLSGARANMIVAREALDSAILMFVDPDDDPKGALRAEALDDVLLNCHAVAQGIQAAQAAMVECTAEELTATEDDVVGDGDGDEDDDDDND